MLTWAFAPQACETRPVMCAPLGRSGLVEIRTGPGRAAGKQTPSLRLEGTASLRRPILATSPSLLRPAIWADLGTLAVRRDARQRNVCAPLPGTPTTSWDPLYWVLPLGVQFDRDHRADGIVSQE